MSNGLLFGWVLLDNSSVSDDSASVLSDDRSFDDGLSLGLFDASLDSGSIDDSCDVLVSCQSSNKSQSLTNESNLCLEC